MAAGLPIAPPVRGQQLLGNRLYTKDTGFSPEERRAFGLTGLVPERTLTLDEQVTIALEQVRAQEADISKYVQLAALQDRNAVLFYRLLTDHLEECLPFVYTPTVGQACQEYSHILRRTRGLWITPDDLGNVAGVLRNSPFEDVRLIVVTDNERILGLGDQGAGGMAIPIGKLALYTAASGIHPVLTLPVSLDVGTDNPGLLADPLYVGRRAPRLRGPEYDQLVDEFVRAVQETWPGCVIQFEDFKQGNALRILDRYRNLAPSFNDDVQGTAGVVLAGILAAMRHRRESIADQRVVVLGAGGAGIGIARILRTAMCDAGASAADATRRVVLVDSRGLVAADRIDLDLHKTELALPAADVVAYGLAAAPEPSSLKAVVTALRPTVLVGVTGVAGSFPEDVIREMARHVDAPIVMPLSNPTSTVEALPSDVLAWTEGRALVATGSPFPPITTDAGARVVGQANNVFIFPGVGLGAIVAEARLVTDEMFVAAARALSEFVTAERFADGGLYPPVTHLREVSSRLALAVAMEARRAGVAGVPDDLDLAAAVAAATWDPRYVDYLTEPAAAT
jgi:malic enzyme